MIHGLYHFFWQNGVGQNLTAGVLVGIPSFLLGRRWVHSTLARHREGIRQLLEDHHRRLTDELERSTGDFDS